MNFLLHRNYANDGSSRKRISLLTNRTNCSWSVNAPWRRLLPVPLNLLFIFFFFFKKKNKIKMTENETLPKQRLSTLWTSSRALSVLFSVWTNAPAPWHHFKRGEVRPRVQGHEVPIWAVHFIRPQMIAPISFSFKFLQNKIFLKKNEIYENVSGTSFEMNEVFCLLIARCETLSSRGACSVRATFASVSNGPGS